MDIRGRKMKRPPACVQCRKRKIGCDRVKPVCGNCHRNNNGNCFYPDVPGKYTKSHSGLPGSDYMSDVESSINIRNPDVMSRKRSGTSVLTRQPSISPGNPGVTAPRPVGRPRKYPLGSNGAASRGTPPLNNYSRETNRLLQNNPELATLEQIREYNTRLQLSNAQDQSRQLGKNGQPQYITRNTLMFDKKTVETALDSNITLNWVQGPAIYDQMTSHYTQEDVLLKEMDFLKNRLLELQDITGKKISGIDLTTVGVDSNPDSPNGNKRRKLDDEENSLELTADAIRKTIDEFKDLDPQFLDPKQVFSIFEKNDNIKDVEFFQNRDASNSIFSLSFLRSRDTFLNKFLINLSSIIKDKKLDVNITNEISNITTNDDSRITFPSSLTCMMLLKRYSEIMRESNTLIPFLDAKELLAFSIQINGDDRPCILDSKTLQLNELIKIGNLSVLLLIIFEMLASSMIIPNNAEQLEAFRILSSFVEKLLTNVILVKQECKLRPASKAIVEHLQFITLWKFYQSISLFNPFLIKNNNNACGNGLIDFDEDIHYSLHISLNHENRDDKQVLLWNFICKNYLWRHIFKGEFASFFNSQLNLNSTPIMDATFNNDLQLLNFQTDIIEYLQTTDRILSIKKIVGMREILKIKYDEQSKRCLTLPLMINDKIDSLIYKNSMLHITYFLLLQYEQNNDLEKFTLLYKEFIQLVHDATFSTFSNLASKNFSGYEFLFQKNSFELLNTICDMVLGLYQRSYLAFNTVELSTELSDSLPNTIREQTLAHANTWIIVIRKLLMLLQDYSKNCKIISPLLLDIMKKMEIIITYAGACEEKSELVSDIKKTFAGMTNIFENLEEDSLKQFNAKVKNMSESLINNNFYKDRKAFTPDNLENMGLSEANCQDVVNAFKE